MNEADVKPVVRPSSAEEGVEARADVAGGHVQLIYRQYAAFLAQHGTNGIAMMGLQEVTAPVISHVDRLEDNLDFMYAREESESASGSGGGGTAARDAADSDNQCVACLSQVKALEMRPIELMPAANSYTR